MGITFSDPDADSDVDTTSWAAVTRAAGFDTFAASPTSANLKALVTDLSYPRVVPTYAAMTALSAANLSDNMVVKATARAVDDDGGEQEFVWDASATDTDDDATVLAHDTITPGRFKALNIIGRSFVRLEQWGADGTAANDRAAWQAWAASGKICELRPGRTYLLDRGLSVVSNSRLIGNGATVQIQVGSGGFNSTDRGDKFNANGQNTCAFYALARENVAFHDIVFTASASTERVVQLIQARDGFDDTQFHTSNILVRDMNVHAGGGLIGAHSIGEGAFLIENIRGLDCGITGTTWTTGTPQLTLVEVDSDPVSETPSRPGGTIRRIRCKNFLFSSNALTTYGQETDLVTLAGATLTRKSLAHYVDDLFADGVGEVLDCMANGARISNIRGENVIFVLKLIHGARYCVATNISGSGIGRGSVGGALITIAGTSTASSGDTMNNVISTCTVESFAVNDSAAVLFQQNTGTVGVPKRNTITGLRVLGDSNGDHYVKDNCTTDADNDNRVYLIDGSAAGTKTVSIVHADNTKVHAVNRAHTQLSLGANQAVTTLATLDFSVATVDPEGIADTANDKVAPKWPGLYLVEIGLRFATDLDDQDTVEIRCVGGGVTQVTRTTIAKSAEQDIVRASFHVLIKEQDIGSATADIYAQCAVEGATDATVLATVDRTGMWLTRVG
jgi:hypothetical protein